MNVTGWNELFNGNMISAAFVLYDTALIGWTVAILFFVFQFMLYLKTKELTSGVVIGLIFLGLYVSGTLIKTASLPIMVIMLVFELGGILYFLIWK